MSLVLFHPRVSPPPPPIGPYCTHAEMVAAHKARQARFAAAGARQEQAQRAIREEARRLREGSERVAAETAAWRRERLAALRAEYEASRPELCAIVTFPSIRKIIVAVALAYEVSPICIMSHRRTRGGPAGGDVVTPRQIAMYLAKVMTLRSLPEIGRQFGGRDHSTVLHATRKISKLIETDPIFAAKVAALRASLEAPLADR